MQKRKKMQKRKISNEQSFSVIASSVKKSHCGNLISVVISYVLTLKKCCCSCYSVVIPYLFVQKNEKHLQSLRLDIED